MLWANARSRLKADFHRGSPEVRLPEGLVVRLLAWTDSTKNWRRFRGSGQVQSPSIDTSNLAPAISGVKAANIGSVTPTFSWDDPGGENVTIDVVVYDLSVVFEATGAPIAIFFDAVPEGETRVRTH
jgi:hypothetical protein